MSSFENRDQEDRELWWTELVHALMQNPSLEEVQGFVAEVAAELDVG